MPIGKSYLYAGPTQNVPVDDAHKITPAFEGLDITMLTAETSNSSRTLDGRMHIGFVNTDMRQITVRMPPLSYAEVARIKALCIGKVCWVRFFDPYTNSEMVKEFYNVDATSTVYGGAIHGGIIKDFTFTLTDMG